MNRKIVKIKRRLLVPYVVIKERATILLSITNTFGPLRCNKGKERAMILLSITNTANSKEKKKKKMKKKKRLDKGCGRGAVLGFLLERDGKRQWNCEIKGERRCFNLLSSVGHARRMYS